MLSTLAVLTVLQTEAIASSRPVTYPVDPQLTASPAANFRELFVDPSALAKSLKPTEGVPTQVEPEASVGDDTEVGGNNNTEEAEVEDTEEEAAEVAGTIPTLTIENPRLASAIVTVSDIKIGILGPLTDGQISGVTAGLYTVSLTYPTGYVHTSSTSTVETEVKAADSAE